MAARVLRALTSELFHLSLPVAFATGVRETFASLHPSRSKLFRWSSKISALAL